MHFGDHPRESVGLAECHFAVQLAGMDKAAPLALARLSGRSGCSTYAVLFAIAFIVILARRPKRLVTVGMSA